MILEVGGQDVGSLIHFHSKPPVSAACGNDMWQRPEVRAPGLGRRSRPRREQVVPEPAAGCPGGSPRGLERGAYF